MTFEHKYTYDSGKIELRVIETESGETLDTSTDLGSEELALIEKDQSVLKTIILQLIAQLQYDLTQKLSKTTTEKFDEVSAPFTITAEEVQAEVDKINDEGK